MDPHSTMDIALEVFPEPIALLDGSLRVRRANAAWHGAKPAIAGALAPEVATAARAVLDDRLDRAEVEAPAGGANAVRYRWTVVRVPGAEPTALVHARALAAGDSDARARALEEENDLLRTMINTVPSMMFIKDWHGRFVVANSTLADMHGLTVDQVLQHSQRDVHGHDEENDAFLRADRDVMSSGRAITLQETVTRVDGDVRWLETTKRPVVRRSGERQVLGFCLDITERKRAEDARDEAAREMHAAAAEARREAAEKAALAAELDRQLGVIQAQHRQIMALSAPILEMGESIIGVPLIGAFDEDRGGALMDRLLAAITGRQARHVILDLTGIEVVDTRTADRLLGIVRAVGLLGAEAVITGIQPAVAQTMVSMGADLGAIATQRTPRDALRALAARDARKPR